MYSCFVRHFQLLIQSSLEIFTTSMTKTMKFSYWEENIRPAHLAIDDS